MALIAAGCRVDTSPRTVIELERGEGLTLTRTRYSGQYQLYKVPEHPTDEWEYATPPLATVQMARKQPLGFRKDDRGRPAAVAGDRVIPLEDGQYEWVMQADAGQYDVGKSILLVAIIVVGVVVIGGIIYFFATTPYPGAL